MGRYTDDQAEKCARVFQAILLRGLMDAGGHRVNQVEERRLGTHKAAAVAWIGTKDFRTVCDLAGINAEQAIAAYNAGIFDIENSEQLSERIKGVFL